MEKTLNRIIAIFVIIALTISILNSKIYGYSGEIDPDSIISFPYILEDGKGTITIKETESNYTLYCQVVEMQNEDYRNILKLNEEGKKTLKTISDQVDSLKGELKTKEEAKDTAKTTLDTVKENEDDDDYDQKLEPAQTNYDNALNDYKNKLEEYLKKIDDYKQQVKNISEIEKSNVADFNDDNWVEAPDGKFKVNIDDFSGQKSFVIWVKLLTSSGNTVYDEGIYTLSGKKVDVESITLDKTTLSLAEEEEYTLKPTIKPLNATNQQVEWTSSDEDIAKVEDGKVTAVKKGKATITATTRRWKNNGNMYSYCY